MPSDRIEPLNDSPRHYGCDIIITLPSGGRVTFRGTGLTMAGMNELLAIVHSAAATAVIEATDAE
jgi:hypothetical protein